VQGGEGLSVVFVRMRIGVAGEVAGDELRGSGMDGATELLEVASLRYHISMRGRAHDSKDGGTLNRSSSSALCCPCDWRAVRRGEVLRPLFAIVMRQ